MDARISSGMTKISNREKILQAGLRVVHEQGFSGASVRDIVTAAGVPQGSFTNNFVSKEAFGLEILDLYFADVCTIIARTLANETLSPLQRLRDYIDAIRQSVISDDLRSGCMLGNFSAEATGHNEPIRQRLVEVFGQLQAALNACLRAAIKAGELPRSAKPKELAGFILSALQGAILLSKAMRSIEPMEQLDTVLFSRLLQTSEHAG
jgi:TetR/AcrR family transcriptional repressor of nem operon